MYSFPFSSIVPVVPLCRDGADVVQQQQNSWGLWGHWSGAEVEIQYGRREDGRAAMQTGRR